MTTAIAIVAGLALIWGLLSVAAESGCDYVAGVYCSDRCPGDHTNGCLYDPKPTWQRRLLWRLDAVIDRYFNATDRRTD